VREKGRKDGRDGIGLIRKILLDEVNGSRTGRRYRQLCIALLKLFGDTRRHLLRSEGGFAYTFETELFESGNKVGRVYPRKLAYVGRRERDIHAILLLEKLLSATQVVADLLGFRGADIDAVTAEYAQIGGDGSPALLYFNCFDRTLTNALEAVLTLRFFGIDRLSRFHYSSAGFWVCS
jgi:hypothetical protein